MSDLDRWQAAVDKWKEDDLKVLEYMEMCVAALPPLLEIARLAADIARNDPTVPNKEWAGWQDRLDALLRKVTEDE